MKTDVEVHVSLRSRLASWLKARFHHERDPVLDFLFEYYRFPPAKLAACSDTSPTADHRSFPASRKKGLEWVIALLNAIESRPIAIGCDGWHEWAMVYKSEHVRHASLPLRLPRNEIDVIVEHAPIRCSHHDAARFFTPEALPLNRLSPHGENRHDMEQGGCLHANMDLYKWAYTFHPWTNGALIWDAFTLAVDIRMLDMRASPYDLSRYGLSPVAIETDAGRNEYRFKQREFAERAAPIRRALKHSLEDLHARRFQDEGE